MTQAIECPRLTRFAAVLACAVPVGQIPVSGGVSCTPEWDTTFGQPIGTKATVRAMAVYDDGSGEALYVGGVSTMTEAGGVVVNRIAKWDGLVWSALGEGVSGGSGTECRPSRFTTTAVGTRSSRPGSSPPLAASPRATSPSGTGAHGARLGAG
ncbi:MAG: hypothetical protein GC161_05970 [Planctomycetaceae bacterium]|nr:hypothetical protein [Planctomycetaceae bacterium]